MEEEIKATGSVFEEDEEDVTVNMLFPKAPTV
jgi:hypothetical protein